MNGMEWMANNWKFIRLTTQFQVQLLLLLFCLQTTPFSWYYLRAWTLSTLELLSIVSEYSLAVVCTGRSVSTLSSLLRQ